MSPFGAAKGSLRMRFMLIPASILLLGMLFFYRSRQAVPVAIPGIYSGKPIDLEVASLVPVKAAVAVHYLPLYMKPALKSKVPPALRKRLKGLTCFHINSTDPAVLEDVRKIIDVGTQFYRDRGYL